FLGGIFVLFFCLSSGSRIFKGRFITDLISFFFCFGAVGLPWRITTLLLTWTEVLVSVSLKSPKPSGCESRSLLFATRAQAPSPSPAQARPSPSCTGSLWRPSHVSRHAGAAMLPV
ncbi:hypothetical protein AALO_G00054730, partial [Alosa alosa]